MRLIYTIGIWFYTLGVRLAALFGHEKARQMVEGWKRWPQEVAKLSHDRPTVWFHAASLGEFEQARPVLEEYRRRHPDHQVLVTFFSPSGYEIRKNYALADAICYLPMDTPRNVRRFVSAANPKTVFFVKYEFWYNYLKALRNRGVKTYIFSTIFRPTSTFSNGTANGFYTSSGMISSTFSCRTTRASICSKTTASGNVRWPATRASTVCTRLPRLPRATQWQSPSSKAMKARFLWQEAHGRPTSKCLPMCARPMATDSPDASSLRHT